MLALPERLSQLFQTLPLMWAAAVGIPKEERDKPAAADDVAQARRENIPVEGFSPANAGAPVYQSNRKVTHVGRRVLQPYGDEGDYGEHNP